MVRPFGTAMASVAGEINETIYQEHFHHVCCRTSKRAGLAMKLQSILIAELLASHDMRGACNALLANFNLSDLSTDAEVCVNHSEVHGDHILIYTAGPWTAAPWYEWSERVGFRTGPASGFNRPQTRAIIWLRKRRPT
jgi:hypothetical protein